MCKYRRIGLAAAIKSDSQKPAALYKRCNAAKPRIRSCAGCAHLATKNSRETKPDSCTARGEAENGAMTWLKSRGGLYSVVRKVRTQCKSSPKGSKIEKKQSRLIFSLEIDFLKKINRFRLIFEKINRKKIKRTYAQNQSNFGSKINRKWKKKSIEHVWYEACFHMTIGHYLFMQEAELSSPNKGAKEWKGYPAQTKV